MYLKHFALTHFPFDQPLAATTLFATNAQAEAEVRLRHLLELRGIGLLTGEPGSGKTTLCRHLTDSLHPGLYRAVYVPLTTGNVMDIYKSIAWEFGLPTERNREGTSRRRWRRSAPTRLKLLLCAPSGPGGQRVVAARRGC